MAVGQRIGALLDQIERDRGIRILYACESGSRAWGFASPDSDYDIRFLFVHPKRSYLSLDEPISSIDLPLIEGELDAGGWDVRKALGLLGKSNGALLEWLHSPIVYRAEPGLSDRWRQAAREVFSPAAASRHYRGLAKQMWLGKLQSEQVRAKDYLYALRASLADRWIREGEGIPPVEFERLLPVAPEEIQEIVTGLLTHKAQTNESERMERLPVLDAFLAQAVAAPVGVEVDFPDRSILERLFRAELRAGSGPLLRAEDFTLARVREPDLLLFDTVAGSHAYGTAVESSDEDRRGVFIAPASFLASLDSIEQVADERSDEVYYELGRFMELLLKNNPNVLELLGSPDDCVRYRHPLFDLLRPELFLSKRCAATFGEYAMGQIRKARGLNKKIVNPQPEKRMELLDFCHVPEGQGSLPVREWLAARGLVPEECGLTALSHANDLFAIYHDPTLNYRGLVSPKDPDALHFSSVPKEARPIGWMSCNRDAFRAHCKAHREYWEWVANRNEARFRTNAEHGRGYDSKNLLHTLRLLDMAEEIATEGVLRVRRPNREFLLQVRAGAFDYDELVERAERRLERVRDAFARSSLPDEPDRERVNALLVQIRREFAND
jgi:predicted nucleotidyltransferase